MRLAMVTPLDPRATGVADYSLDLLPHLAAVAGQPITVFTSEVENRSGSGWFSCPIDQLRDRADHFELLIYQMGNSPAHDFMAEAVLAYPGLVVLHDVSLSSFYLRQVQACHPAGYWHALGYAYGVAGTAAGRQLLRHGAALPYPQYLLSEWLAARSPGVIVHSQHAAQLLQTRSPLARITTIPMAIPLPAIPERSEARRRLHLPPDAYLLLVFGVLNESKHPRAILRALRLLIEAGLPARAVFIGAENSGFQLSAAVAEQGLAGHVSAVDFVTDLTLVQLWMAAVDVAIGLRAIYWGETPSSTLRLLAAGLPVVVNDIGAFAELPDEVCCKIAPEEADTAGALFAILRDLYEEADRRTAMGRAAREYIVHVHDPAATAHRYLQAAEAVVQM